MNAHVLKQIEKIAISSDIIVEWFDKPVKKKKNLKLEILFDWIIHRIQIPVTINI